MSLVAALTASPALAAQIHPFTGTSFGPDGTPATSFASLQGVAVDPSSGDVYAFDAGAHKVYKFDASGNPVNFSALGANAIEGTGGSGNGENEIAVAPLGSPGGTAGDIYVANNAVVRIYAPTGTMLGELTEGENCGVATSPSGHVFVGNFPNKIREFTPSANPVTNGDQTGVSSAPGIVNGGLCNVAADGLGNVYAANWSGNAGVVKLAGLGAASATQLDPHGSTLAVDPTSNDVYVDRGSSVAQYNSSGATIGVFGAGQISSSHGVAVNGTSDEIYAGDGSSGHIDLFGPEITVPGVSTEAPTAVGGTKATLHGSVNPDGLAVSTCEFEYGTTTAYGNTAPCEGPIPPDSSDHPVSAALTGLKSSTTYHFRLVATNANGTNPSGDLSFGTGARIVTGASTAIHPPNATVEGIVNPEGTPLTECAFEYGTSTEPYGASVPCAESPATIGAGTDPVGVHVELGGLSFEATYHYRLKITDAHGTEQGQDGSFRTPGTPVVEEQQASAVTDTEAELSATINPKGLPTSYHFEYGTTTAYGQSTAEAEVGSDEENIVVASALTGLQPDTTYHWRAVATNSHAVTEGTDHTFTTFPIFSPETNCPNQALRTGASAALPDCRAYEMVSPSQKAGEVFPPTPKYGTCDECLPGEIGEKMPMQVSPDGEAIVYEGQPFAEGLASRDNEYLARRGADGWATQGLSSALTSPLHGAYEGFSPDLSRGVRHQVEPALSPEAPSKEGKAYTNLYLYEEGKAPRPLVTQAPPNRDPGEYEPGNERFEIRFGDGNSGTKSTPAYSHLVFAANDALTGPTANAPVAVGPTESGLNNLYEWVDGQLRLVNVDPGNTTTAPGVVLGSGSLLPRALEESSVVDRAISADGSHIFWSEESGQLYVRIDGKETKKIEDPGLFLTASADGSKVLLSDGCLYDLAGEECEDLTDGEGGFAGILGSAEDLSRIYFVDGAALTPLGEENARHEHAEAEKVNLYTWHGGSTAFVGILAGNPHDRFGQSDDNLAVANAVSLAGDWRASIGTRTAQVSPDGRYLTFMSQNPLTGYDSTRKKGECGAAFAVRCAEVFEYDADTEELSCASCNPSGERPLGISKLSLITAQGNPGPLPQPGNLSAEGRIFFESQDVLTARDTNGTIQDVYEWKPNGVGGCARANGCIALISSGQSPNDSMFVDSTPSGSDAFFITREQLLLKDQDDQLDLYDARASGGISEAKAPPCQGEACKGPASSAGEGQSPGSASFVGPGNEKPKKQSKHHKHKKKSHKHKHKSKAHKRAAKHNRGGSK